MTNKRDYIEADQIKSRPAYLPGHASHIFILAALGRTLTAKNIVEYGGGIYSTNLCFLNRSLFPHVQSVITYESDSAWIARIRYMANFDKRHRIIARLPTKRQIQRADLIFIDNGPGHEGRKSAIDHCLSSKPEGLIILHDAQEEQYSLPLEDKMKHMIYIDCVYPHVALFWNHADYIEQQMSDWLSHLEIII